MLLTGSNDLAVYPWGIFFIKFIATIWNDFNTQGNSRIKRLFKRSFVIIKYILLHFVVTHKNWTLY